MRDIISIPARHVKSLDTALNLYKEIQKLPKGKLYGISHIGYSGFAITKQRVVSHDRIIQEIESINYALEKAQDEGNEKAVYYYKAQLKILKRLLKE